MSDTQHLAKISTQVRRDIIRMVTSAQSGHPGGSMSSADVLTALFFKQMNHDPKKWDRSGAESDMFFLSAGHLSPLYYSVLARSGYFDLKELNTFRVLGSRLQGHPSADVGLPGVHEASGSLGQGLSVAIGAALGKKLNNDHNRVYVLLGDGECEEGQIWEAAMYGAHKQTDNLVAIVDWNNQQIDGTVDSIMGLTDLDKKWEAFGWSVVVSEGNDMAQVINAFEKATSLLGEKKPVIMLMRTEMGYGVDFMSGTNEWHGKAPSPDLCERALAQLEETLGDF